MTFAKLAISTDDPVAASDRISRQFGSVQLAPFAARDGFHLRFDVTDTPSVAAGRALSHTGLACGFALPYRNLIGILPVAGGIELTTRAADEQVAEGEFAFVLSDQLQLMRVPRDGVLRVVMSSLATVLTALGEPAAAPGGALDRLLRGGIRRAAVAGGRLAAATDALVACPLDADIEPVRADLDLAFAAGVSAVLGLAEPPRAPARSRIAEARDFIVANAARPLRLDHIAGAVGMSPRILQLRFKSLYGVTPMALLQRVRLERCREELATRGASTSVAAVARRWGFAHLGRFAQYYRRTFGETPSDTARRGRV